MPYRCGWTPPPPDVYMTEAIYLALDDAGSSEQYPLPSGLIEYFSPGLGQMIHSAVPKSHHRILFLRNFYDDILKNIVNWFFTGYLNLEMNDGPLTYEIAPHPNSLNQPGGGENGSVYALFGGLDYENIVNIYLFAHEYSMAALCNDAVSVLYEYVKASGKSEAPQSGLILVYEDAPSSSFLQNLVVEMLALDPVACRELKNHSKQIEGLLNDVLERLLCREEDSQQGNRLPLSWNDIEICDFHEHTSPEEE
ncbi:MAG: hypothetical protein M1831_004903 [Alyxoria varia]|nr:MAG: hypothetical protein M1831_004903 [Alyxoria varia]